MTDPHTSQDAIREALQAIADEAPAAERVRASLTGRARAHRQRRMLLTAGGLATAGAAVGVAGYALTTRERRVPRPAETPPGRVRVPYAYDLGWLPDGVVLNQLGAVVDGGDVRLVRRRWQLPGSDDISRGPWAELVIGDHVLGGNGDYDGAKSFDINGVEGKLKIRAFKTPATDHLPGTDRWGDLAWDPPDAPPLRVHYVGDGSYDEDDPFVRMARSLRPDRRSFGVEPRFGWLPGEFSGGVLTIEIGVHGGGWYQTLTAYPADGISRSGPPSRTVSVLMGTAEPHRIPVEHLTGSHPVRGLDGRYLGGHLRFTLPDGVIVQVQVPDGTDDGPPPPDLLRIAEEFDFGAWPDMSWAGQR